MEAAVIAAPDLSRLPFRKASVQHTPVWLFASVFLPPRTSKLRFGPNARGPEDSRNCEGHLSVQFSFLSYSSPLLKKEGNRGFSALGPERLYPGPLQRSRTWSALASNDHPMDAGQIERAKVFKQGFY